MIRELRHRSGNLFSQLLALFSQTAKNAKTMAELTSKYQARVLALANAHRLITEAGWKSTSLDELLRVVLGPYLDRTTLNGPNVDVAPDPTFTLSAALHELAANAIKHGSLSRSKGRLEVSWSAKRTESGMTLTLGLGRAERPADAAAAADRIWLAPDRPCHRAADERGRATHLFAARLVSAHDRPADARALADAAAAGGNAGTGRALIGRRRKARLRKPRRRVRQRPYPRPGA